MHVLDKVQLHCMLLLALPLPRLGESNGDTVPTAILKIPQLIGLGDLNLVAQ